jgi:competence protein ComEC
VGQGLAAVVRTSGHTLVYDVGPAFASGFNTGDAVVLPFLREQGVSQIDLLLLSHADRDHAGGLAGLAGRIPFVRILSGEAAELGDLGALPCRAGERWTWEGVGFELLHPDVEGLSGNDASCVLRVSTAGASLLLPGDIERGVEQRLAAGPKEALRSHVLVAAHHGSASSSSPEFLRAVSPAFVLYSAGLGNAFGFPSREVREHVSRLGAREADTASAGAIAFRLTREGLVGPFIQRDRTRRVWTHRPEGGSF